MTAQPWQLAILGAAAGAFGAPLGVGGGVIIVPALTLGLGLPFRSAVAASLVCVVATSVASSIVHLGRGRVELHLGVELQFYTVFGAVAAGLLAASIPPGPLYLAFALLLAYAAWHMYPRPAAPAGSAPPEPLRRPHAHRIAAGASVGAGLVSGLLGVGGGMINTPVLHLLLGVPFDRAAATSAYMIGLTGAASALVYLARGDIVVDVAGPTMFGTLAGSALAAAVGHRVRQRWLKLAFTALLGYVAVQMVLRGVARF